MLKRILIVFFIILAGIFAGVLRIYYWSFNESFHVVSINNSSYNLKVGLCRGNIYDCNKIPLVNETLEQYCAVFPSIDACNSLSKILPQDKLLNCIEYLNSGKPFCIKLDNEINEISTKNLRLFKIPKRYPEKEDQIMPHILGYLSSSGEGICAIEKSFEDCLKNCTGEINISYKTNALGKIFKNKAISIRDSTYKHKGGVVLTIDKKIQRIVHDIAKEKMKKGTIIVSSVKNFEIKALVSMPEFDCKKIEESINKEDSPFLNRALQSYNAGSVFKLVTAMAFLEENFEGLENYNCESFIVAGNSCFHCANCRSHGKQDVKEALSNSCNTYFLNFAKYLNPEKFHRFCKNLGFGKSTKLAEDIVSQAGYLPNEEELKDLNEMALLSFGQGKLMVTPLQILSLINTIACNGEYKKPTLVLGLLNTELKFLEKFKSSPSKKVVSQKTVDEVKKGMKMCAEKGTGTLGKPENIEICAKTSTAQTGLKSGLRNVLQGWYAGFFPAKDPKYCVLVMMEDVESGGADCGPVFKEVVEKISKI